MRYLKTIKQLSTFPLLAVLTFLLVFPSTAQAKKAIVVASFGTTYPSALEAILNIKSKIEKAIPGVPIKLAFTSNIIRAKWHTRQKTDSWQKKNPDVPKEIMYVKGPLATIADLQDQGYKEILVQPLYVFAGEQFRDLQRYVKGLESIKTMKPRYNPFKKIALGRPALGRPGTRHPYSADIKRAALALKEDAEKARNEKITLIYMAHGNHYYSTGVFMELEAVMRETYPGVTIYIAGAEGFPSIDHVLVQLKKTGTKKVKLVPLLVVAGNHANKDMAGPGPKSWKSKLEAAGIEVKILMRGLGQVDAWADIYVQNALDAWDENFKEKK